MQEENGLLLAADLLRVRVIFPIGAFRPVFPTIYFVWDKIGSREKNTWTLTSGLAGWSGAWKEQAWKMGDRKGSGLET